MSTIHAMSNVDDLTPTSPPPSQSDGSAFSLLSLSIAASNAAPIPVTEGLAIVGSTSTNGNSSSTLTSNSAGTPLSLSNGGKQHRRLASTGKARRRLSDARDAANRPSPAALQSAAAALSLSSLSLSSSPPPVGPGVHISTSLAAASSNLGPPMIVSVKPEVRGGSTPTPSPFSDGSNIPSHYPSPDESKGSTTAPIPIGNGKQNKKRGVDHKCESCSKIYRHPSCLIKHRWEHTPHWREASKFVLSKHQQVQLLEAAAILSHMSPSSTGGSSLPEDRSLWPSFLSGGSLPAPDGTMPTNTTTPSSSIPAPPTSVSPYPTSSSVPALSMMGHYSRAASAGPRLHDYSIPLSAAASGGITQVRPGLLGVPTGPIVVAPTPPMPVPVPNANGTGNADPEAFGAYREAMSESWGSSPYGNRHTPSSYYSAGVSSNSLPYAHSDERSVGAGAGGWSLPRSSLRSVSSQSRSRSGSASGSRSDDESVEVDVDVEGDSEYGGAGYGARYGFGSGGRPAWKREEDELSIGFSVREEEEEEDAMAVAGIPPSKARQLEWDEMEMDMDMD